MQLAAEGEFKGHPDGPFEITREHLESMLRAARARRSEIAVDLEHKGGPATGWINPSTVEIARDEHGRLALFGMGRWTPRFAEAIRGEEYRYFSPVIAFGSKDRESGETLAAELIEGALTNNPFIDGMSAVALSRLRALSVQGGPMEDMPEEAPPAEAGADDAQLAELGRLIMSVLEIASVDDAKAFLTENADMEQLLSALVAKAGGDMSAEPAPEQMAANRALKDELKRLSAANREQAEQIKAIRFEADAAKVCSEMGLDSADKETVARYVALRRTDSDSYAEIRAARGKAAPPGGREVKLSRAGGSEPEASPKVKDLTPGQQALYRSLSGTGIDKAAILKAVQKRSN